jgi:5-methyltetrahydrofolate--homocysteine methyltransferase
MSALLTTTMVYMRTVVQKMKEAGLHEVKICIGGAPVSADYAREIGADGYAADAATAVELFKRLLGIGQPQDAPEPVAPQAGTP